MHKILIVLTAGFLCTQSFALRGVFVGATAGQVVFTSGAYAPNPSMGYGVQSYLRVSKTVDFLLTILDSVHTGGIPINHLGATGSAEFHPMQLDSLEVTLGIGIGAHAFSSAAATEWRPEANLGAGVDLKIGKPYRLGFIGRVHFLNEGVLGGNMQAVQVRFGYLFDLLS